MTSSTRNPEFVAEVSVASVDMPAVDQAAEEACLGAAMDNDEAATLVAQKLTAAQFYYEAHRHIHAAIVALVARKEGVDLVTVAAEVERGPGLESIRGRDYLHVLVESVPAATHVRQYIARVAEKALQRSVQRELRSALETASDGGLSGDGLRRLSETVSGTLVSLQHAAGEQAWMLPVYDGVELAEMHLETPEAICEGLLYKGCSTDLVGEVKGGKTTLILDVTRSVIGGAAWCERSTRKGGVLYLSEQSPHSFAPQCARAGLLGQRAFHVVFHGDARSLSWPEIGEFVICLTVEAELDLVVIDNLSLWAGIEGEEENDAGVALQTLRVIEAMTAAGLAVLSLRHARKGGGSISEAGRGSSAIAGGFDIIAQLRADKLPRRRLLEATGRVFAAEPQDLVIEMDEDHRYTFVAHGSSVARHDARATIIELLSTSREEALGEAEIIASCQATGVGKTTTQKVLRELSDGSDPGRLVERAKGAGSVSPQAYGYWRRSDAI